jgi:signal transduction histidine kinase
MTGQGPAFGASERRAAADDSRRSFLRMVSHELRTPLNSIIGFSEILNQELCGPIGSPQYKEYAGLIGQSGHRLLKLVNQILDIVRLEGDAADLDLSPEPLDPVVQDAFHQLRDEAAPRGVRLEVDVAGPLPDVIADPRAVRTILINLLQNAVAAAPSGSVIHVRARRFGAEVCIEVQDYGDGVESEDLDRIVRPFEQGEHALTRHTQGAGLGLPIVRLLAEAMSGRLELRSSRGAGFIAAVTLPAA